MERKEQHKTIIREMEGMKSEVQQMRKKRLRSLVSLANVEKQNLYLKYN